VPLVEFENHACGLTDLELSGAPPWLPGEADAAAERVRSNDWLADRSEMLIGWKVAAGRISWRIEFCIEQFLDSLVVTPDRLAMLMDSIRDVSSEVG